MAVGFVGAYGEAGVEEEDAVVSPGGQEAGTVGWRAEGGVVFFQGCVHVFERGRGGCRWAHGKAEAVGLVEVVIGILAEDYCFYCWEGCVARPGERMLDEYIIGKRGRNGGLTSCIRLLVVERL